MSTPKFILKLPHLEAHERQGELPVWISLPCEDGGIGRDLLIGIATVTVGTDGRATAEIEWDYQGEQP